MTRSTNSKYLVVMEPEDEFPEQMNSYILLVMEMLLLAKQTNRIFVFPLLHSHPRNNSKAENGEMKHRNFVLGKMFLPMENIFDQEILNKYISTLSYKDFLDISGRTLDSLFSFNNRHFNLVDSYGSKLYCQNIFSTKETEDVIKSPDRFVGITGYQRGKYLVKSTSVWPEHQINDYWEIRKHLQYRKEFIALADKFIKKRQLDKFIAVHWRRGDRVHPEMTTLSEIIVNDRAKMKKLLDNYLINPIKEIMEKQHLQRVFLATNSGTKWHLDYLKRQLPIVLYPPSGSWRNREKEAIVEQVICSKADFFLAAPFNYQRCSNFSRWIIDTRIVEGRGDSISYQRKMGFEENNSPAGSDISLQIRKQLISLFIPIIKRLVKISRKILNFKINVGGTRILDVPFFDLHKIKIDARSLQVGGSWMPQKRGSVPRLNDLELLQIFYKLIPRNKPAVLYDIGASTGSFSMVAKFNPAIRVYAFEPQPSVFEILVKNIAINNLTKQIKAFQIALTEEEKILPLQVPLNRSYSGLATLGAPLRFSEAQSINVASTTLNKFAREFMIPEPTHIKIDTEGAELLVLRGGEKLIRRAKPIMLLECDEKNTSQFGYHAEKLIKFLVRFDYKIRHLSSGDILCLPKEKSNN